MGRVNRQPDSVWNSNLFSVFFTSFIGFLFYDALLATGSVRHYECADLLKDDCALL